jgi:hypothetical protein
MTENIILKLSSGEEIVCRLVEDTQSGMIQITNPLLVSTTPRVTSLGLEESVSLRRWIHFSEEQVYSINKSMVVTKADASLGLSRFYELCVLKMLRDVEDEIRVPTEEELMEIEAEEAFDEWESSLTSKTIH